MHYKRTLAVSTYFIDMGFAGGENDRYHLHSKYGIYDAGKLLIHFMRKSICSSAFKVQYLQIAGR
jgi:hypothetical protein